MAEVETMSVLVVEPGKKAESRDIPKTLEGMQAVVGGPIEFLSFNGLREHAITVYCNEEGKYDERCKPNLLLEAWTGVYQPDELCGTFFFCGTSSDDGDDRSLNPAELLIALGWLDRCKRLNPLGVKGRPFDPVVLPLDRLKDAP